MHEQHFFNQIIPKIKFRLLDIHYKNVKNVKNVLSVSLLLRRKRHWSYLSRAP